MPFRSSRSSGTSGAIGALASEAAATVATTLGRLRPHRERPGDPPPPYSPSDEDTSSPPPPYSPPANGAPPPYSAVAPGAPPPAYTRVPKGTFDPKDLTDFQLDELTHRMIGRITRLIRTELRMDRERIGRLRDDRR
ncbi:hypothetical protein GCM10010349_23320 [Streptomyces flavofungini]|nr:hypothetical protein GCM10010349_23320 [Streptomyces flavofungini]